MKTHTENKIEVSHICSNGKTFDVVWHHAKNFVQHFIVEVRRRRKENTKWDKYLRNLH